MRAKFPRMLTLIVVMLALGAILGGCATLQQQWATGKQVVVDLTAAEAPNQIAVATHTPVVPISKEKAQNLWQNIREQGQLVVAVSGDAPPFVFYNADGELQGSDVETMRKLGENLGLEIIFQRVPAEQLLDKVQTGELNAAIGGIAITPQSAEKVAFSDPYRSIDLALLLNQDAQLETLTSIEELANYRLGAGQNDALASWLLELVDAGTLQRENISLYPSAEAATAALADGKIDIVITDALTGQKLTASTPGQLQLLNKKDDVVLTFKPLRNQTLQHTQWQLVSYSNDSGQQIPVLSSAPITATITDAIIMGNAGCNAYAADIQINEANLTITPPVIPRHQCEAEGVMTQENNYLDALLKAATYTIEGDALIFRDEAGEVLLLFKAAPQLHLADSQWQLVAYGSVSRPQTLPAETSVTLTIGPDGKFSGTSGCNDYTGTLTTQDASTHFALGPATLKACDPASNTLETTYLQALAQIEHMEQQQDRLILSYNSGMDALVFRAQRQNPLQFSDWELIAFGSPEADNAPLTTTQLTASFGKAKLSGSAGCNAFETKFSVDGTHLQIGKIALTSMLCPDEKVTAQEKSYVKKLRNTRSYQFTGFKMVTSDLHQQRFAIALPPGADELLSMMNQAVAQWAEQRAITAANAETNAEATPEPPTTKPACKDKLKWLEDVTYDDHNMRKPPRVDPGTAFQKVWRVKNVGTCTWNSEYYLDFFEGNKPGAQMSGQRTYVAREVKPGETYELKLNLRAPLQKGKYQGFWKFYNGNMRPFAKLWVGIKVPKPATPFPTPTPTPEPEPQPILQLTATRTHMQPKQCTILTWHTENIAQAYLFKNDEPWEGNEVEADGTQEICLETTSTYHLGATLADGSQEVKSLTIEISAIAPPQIVSFESNPPEQLTPGQKLTILWNITGDVQKIDISRNGIPTMSNAPSFGSLSETPAITGTITYTLQAVGPGGISQAGLVVQVVDEAPTPTPEPLADAPGVELIAGWLLTGITNDAGEAQTLLPDTAIILAFDTGGNFNGFAGCNNYSGLFSVRPGNGLTLQPAQLTRMACDQPQGVMAQEQAYMQLLERVSSYQVDAEGVLQLETETGATLSFIRNTAP